MTAGGLTTLWLLGQSLLCVTALSCLCLAQGRVLTQPDARLSSSQRRWMRWLGMTLFSLSLLLAVTHEPLALALTSLVAVLTPAALLVTLLASYHPRRLPTLALVSASGSLITVATIIS